MSATASIVAGAFLWGLPPLLGLLGVTAFGRDRVSALVLLAVSAGLVLANLLIGLPGVFWLWAAAAPGLAVRLRRDQRRGHVRSTFESLLVLGSGAILVATLVSLPSLLAEIARLRMV